MKRLAAAGWIGFSLAALFFYPLVVTLDSDSYYLHWQSADIVEVALALAVLSAAATVVVYAVWRRTSRAATAVLMAIAALPVASLLSGIARQLPFEEVLIVAWDNPVVRLAVPLGGAAVIIGAFVSRPELLARLTRRILVLISPVSLLVLITLAMSARLASVERSIDRTLQPGKAIAASCAPVLALLFDELSFSYLYRDGQVASSFPRLAEFGSQATHYLEVRAANRETLTSVPSFLAGRALHDVRVEDGRISVVSDEGHRVPMNVAGPDGLFGTARRLGFQNEIAGYYLAYCDLLGGLADRCRAFSFYNVSSTADRFSLLDPIETTFVLWPRQFPLGLFKARPFARHQRALVAQTMAFASRPVARDRPTFRFVHFSVPHLPFAFDATGYNPPFDPLRTSTDAAYLNQMAYVDTLAGDLFDRFRADGTYDRATIVVFADHGYRFGGREQDPLHIPFIVKEAGQRERRRVDGALGGEALLKQVVQQACAAP